MDLQLFTRSVVSEVSDWRADIKGHDTLYDLDPMEVMVFHRHQYLQTAYDLCGREDAGDNAMGEHALSVALILQEAIELQCDLVRLEPAHTV